MAASIWAPGTTTNPTLPSVAPVQFVKGSASNPGITFVGDIETGIWSEADGYINFTVNGVTKLTITPAGNVVFGGKFVSNVEVDIASSTTIDLGGAASNSVCITGDNTITSLGTNYQGPIFVRFSGSPLLNHSTSLALPGAANISVTAGATALFMPKATAGVSDGWICIAFQSASGGGNGGGGATGAVGNQVFYENDMVVTGDYTIKNGKNAGSFGPITIDTGVTVTVPTGATWSIV